MTEFEARTCRDALIRTFADRRQALRWWNERAVEFPGCRLDVIETETVVTRRALRRPRIAA